MNEASVHFWSASDGVELAYHELGEGRPVVLLHGLFSDAVTNWIKFGHAARIAADGFRVIMPDLPPNPLPAPQATLISALAQGVIGGRLDWNMIGIGAAVGVVLIIIDSALGAMKKLRIPPLAVGIGIYLPMSATFAVIVGAIISHWYDKRARAMPNPERSERLGTLVASGLIVGESLWGVVNAGLIVGLNKDAPIGIVPEEFAPGRWLGLLGFIAMIVWLYGWMLRRSARAPAR